MKARAILVAGALICAPVLAACADHPETHVIVALDVSGSFPTEQLEPEAQKSIDSQLKVMAGTSSVSLLAFSSQVGTIKCQAPSVSVEWAGNSAKYEEQKRRARASLVAALPEYLTCATKAVATKTSDVIGAIVEAGRGIKGAKGDRRVILVTDGCQSTYGIFTCENSRMLDEKYRASVIEKLPGALKPDLSGVTIQICRDLLGKNSGMEQPGKVALGEFYAAYAKSLNAIFDDCS